jgi:RNA polymerase sigma-70 factor (ECF subfamily)
MSDGELVRQALAGRTEAFEELVRRWAGRVSALCHARVACSAAADDLAQEAFLRAYRALASLDAEDKFGPWLCRIAHHACLNWLQTRRRAHIPFSVLGSDHNPEDVVDRPAVDEAAGDHEEDLRRLRAEVAALPEPYREVVLLYYHQKVTYRDLADQLNVSTATINARLTKARALLRARLGACRPEVNHEL